MMRTRLTTAVGPVESNYGSPCIVVPFPACLEVRLGLEVMAVHAVLVACLVEVPTKMARPMAATVAK